MMIRPGQANQIIGRWHDVRLYGLQGISAPYIFDRRTGGLAPHQRDEWVYDDETEQWYAAVKGAAGFRSSLEHGRLALLSSMANLNISGTTFALNTQYTYNSAGRAASMRIKINAAKTVSSVYAYLDSKTGSPTTLDWEIRDSTGSPGVPGSTVVGSGTVTISGVTAPSWISASSLSVSLSADTEYFLIWANTLSDAATNTGTIWTGNLLFTSPLDYGGSDGMTTTDGFAADRTRLARVPPMVIGFNGSTAIGNPLISNTTPASDTNRKGLYCSTGFTEQLKIFGLASTGLLTNSSGFEIYDSSATVPGTGALSIGTVNAMPGSTGVVGYYLSTPYTCVKNVGYRFVFTYSGNSNTPSYHDIGTGADSVLASALLGGGGWYFSRANGTSNWGNDVTTGFPRVSLIIENQVESGVSLLNRRDNSLLVR